MASDVDDSDVEGHFEFEIDMIEELYENQETWHSGTPILPAMSCSTIGSNNITPLPVRKYVPSDSDAGTDFGSVCRICQYPEDKENELISPCRCAGTLMYIHRGCLRRWIEISTRRTRQPPRCELCKYEYTRRRRFRCHNWRLPRINRRDKFLHVLFFITVLIMMACAVATVMCFLSDKTQIAEVSKDKVKLTVEEIITLGCGVMFFVSFFIAMTVEIKAKHTVYKLFLKFVNQNTEWEIQVYERNKDEGNPVSPEVV